MSASWWSKTSSFVFVFLLATVLRTWNHGSPTKDRIHAPCSGSTEYQLLDCQAREVPRCPLFCLPFVATNQTSMNKCASVGVVESSTICWKTQDESRPRVHSVVGRHKTWCRMQNQWSQRTSPKALSAMVRENLKSADLSWYLWTRENL